MTELILRLKDVFSQVGGVLLRAIQKPLLLILLTLIYLVGIGVTALFAAVFDRRLLWSSRREQKSFWKDAEDYSPDPDKLMRQS